MKASLQPGKSFGSAASSATVQRKDGLKTITDNRPTAIAQRKLQHQLNHLIKQSDNKGVAQLNKITKNNTCGVFTAESARNIQNKNDGKYLGAAIEISFKLNNNQPDEEEIYFQQIVKVEHASENYEPMNSDNLGVNCEFARDIVKTKGLHNEDVGYFIDYHYRKEFFNREPRLISKIDEISPAYNQDGGESHGRVGKKVGNDNRPAILRDEPMCTEPTTMYFQSIVLGKKSNKVYGTLFWTMSMGTEAIPKINIIKAEDGKTKEYEQAVANFNEFYRNPGSATSPERFKFLLENLDRTFVEVCATLSNMAEQYKICKNHNYESINEYSNELKGAIENRIYYVREKLEAMGLDADNLAKTENAIRKIENIIN